MYIYSSYDFDGSRDMSRALLAKAFDHCMNDFATPETAQLGITGRQLVQLIETGEHGKPYIEDFLSFSVSHTGNAWAVLIATEDCGLDIQFSKPCRNMDRISEKYYTEEERALIAEEGEEAFWKVWTRREAAIKAVGATVVSSVPDVTGESVVIDGTEYWLSEVELLGAAEIPYGAMCTREEPKAIHYFRL